jgi:hypothetical protein
MERLVGWKFDSIVLVAEVDLAEIERSWQAACTAIVLSSWWTFS